MRNIALSSLELDLVYLATACESQQPTTGDVRVSPVGETELDVVLRLEAQSVAGPGQEGLALADEPVLAAIEVDSDYAGDGRLCGDEGGHRAGGRDLLVEKGNADGGAAEGLEDGEGREGVFGLPAEADQGAATGEEGLGGGERDGEEREGRADDVEAGVWRRVSRAVRVRARLQSEGSRVYRARRQASGQHRPRSGGRGRATTTRMKPWPRC